MIYSKTYFKYDTYSGAWSSFNASAEFKASYKSDTTEMSGQEYLAEYNGEKEKQEKKELEKDWQDMSSGPVK